MDTLCIRSGRAPCCVLIASIDFLADFTRVCKIAATLRQQNDLAFGLLFSRVSQRSRRWDMGKMGFAEIHGEEVFGLISSVAERRIAFSFAMTIVR